MKENDEGVPLFSWEVRRAFAIMMALTDEERGEVMCWFCRGCFRYMGPGDYCQCENDE